MLIGAAIESVVSHLCNTLLLNICTRTSHFQPPVFRGCHKSTVLYAQQQQIERFKVE